MWSSQMIQAAFEHLMGSDVHSDDKTIWQYHSQIFDELMGSCSKLSIFILMTLSMI